MVGDHRGTIADAVTRLGGDPPGKPAVANGAHPARHLGVADVAHDTVGEGVLGLPFHRGDPFASHELPTRQLTQQTVHVELLTGEHGGDRPRPERLAHRGRRLENRLGIRVEQVDARRHHRLHTVGKSGIGGGLRPVSHHPGELLGPQRIAPRPRGDRRPTVGIEAEAGEQLLEQQHGGCVVERLEADGHHVALAGSPGGMVLEELGPCGAHEQQGRAARRLGKGADELDQRRLGPVEILEHDDRGALLGECRHIAGPGGEPLHLVGAGLQLGTHQRGEPAGDPVPLLGVGHQDVQGDPQLAHRGSRRIRLQDPRLGLDDLGERPEGDALAVCETSSLAPSGEVGQVVDVAAQLPDHPRLAHPGLTADGDDLTGPLPDQPVEGVGEQAELAVATDEGGAVVFDIHSEPSGGNEGDPHRQRLPLPAHHHRGSFLVPERSPGRPVSRFVDQHRPRRGLVLQPGGGVDHVTDEALAVHGRALDGDDRLPGAHRHPGAQDTRPRHLGDPLLDAQPGPYRPLGVVLVHHRRSEHREHAVTHQFLDATAVALHLLTDRLVIGAEPPTHVLGIGPVARRGEPDQVGEYHRHHLALLTSGLHRGLRRLPRGGGAARRAEPGAVGQRGGTRGASPRQGGPARCAEAGFGLG